MKRGNLKKCVIFYVLGAIMSIAGLVLLIVSLTVRFKTYDSFAYIGGIVLLMGLSLVFLWYNFTIPYDEEETEPCEVRATPVPSAGPLQPCDRKSLPRNSVMPSASESFELREPSNHQRRATYDNPAFNDDSATTAQSYDDDDGLRVVTTKSGGGDRTYHVNT